MWTAHIQIMETVRLKETFCWYSRQVYVMNEGGIGMIVHKAKLNSAV